MPTLEDIYAKWGLLMEHNGSLRGMKPDDAPLMLEWMHEEETANYFRTNFDSMDLEGCKEFIRSSRIPSTSLNLAVASPSNDEYLGTISLKNINPTDASAEYAISMRACARGTGAAQSATHDILGIAFDILRLHRVYLNVRTDNLRANRFYEKCSFRYEGTTKESVYIRDKFVDLNWYAMLEGEYRAL